MLNPVTELDLQLNMQAGEWKEAIAVCKETLMIEASSEQIQIVQLLYYLAFSHIRLHEIDEGLTHVKQWNWLLEPDNTQAKYLHC